MMEYISFEEILMLEPNDQVIVNRVRINSKAVELNLKNQTPDIIRQRDLISNAMHKLSVEDKASRVPLFGTTMAVCDVIVLFKNDKCLPGNTFVRLSSYNHKALKRK